MSPKISKDDAAILHRVAFNNLRNQEDSQSKHVAELETRLMNDRIHVAEQENRLAKARIKLADCREALDILESLR